MVYSSPSLRERTKTKQPRNKEATGYYHTFDEYDCVHKAGIGEFTIRALVERQAHMVFAS